MPTVTTASGGSGFSPVAAAGVQEFTTERRQEFEDVLSRDLPRLRKLATHWLRNRADAEDAVQDALLSAFTHITQFSGRAKMSTWLTAIVINAVRMQMRKRGRASMLSLDWVPNESRFPISALLVDSRLTADRAMERGELFALAIGLARALPPPQRAALRLRYQDDYSIGEAAKKLRVPVGTLKAQLARGRANLKQRFHKTLAKRKAHMCQPSVKSADEVHKGDT
jgi:RNA polymerase sigma-70 factor (ECF subfamily)